MDHGGRNWAAEATRQGMLAATRSWKRQGTDSPLQPPEGPLPYRSLNFSPVILVLDSRFVRINFSYSLLVRMNSDQICGHLLQQPKEVSTPRLRQNPKFLKKTSSCQFLKFWFSTQLAGRQAGISFLYMT